MANYLKTLAGDLLHLEVNTILKSNTTGCKMPSSKRVALYDIAERYRAKLIEFGLCHIADGMEVEANKFGFKTTPLRWIYAGENSFVELKTAAHTGHRILANKYEQVESVDLKRKLDEQLNILTRIERQSSNLIGIFKERRKTYAEEISSQKPGCSTEKVITEDPLHCHPSQEQSHVWNNDISLSDINKLEDIELSPDQLIQIRKIWELGTEQVLLQTVIQIDGDVTSYITPKFTALDDELKKTILNIHNDSIQTSTTTWGNLINFVSKLAGKAFSQIFSK